MIEQEPTLADDEPFIRGRAFQKPIEEKQSRDTETSWGKTLSAGWTCPANVESFVVLRRFVGAESAIFNLRQKFGCGYAAPGFIAVLR